LENVPNAGAPGDSAGVAQEAWARVARDGARRKRGPPATLAAS
jgi:hypothetical protein